MARKTSERRSNPPITGPRRTPGAGLPSWWHAAAVALLALVCYIQAASYDFVYDDDVQIVLNSRIRSFSSVGLAFSENFWAFNAPGSFSNYYRPLQTVAYIVCYAIGGLSPAPYHWLNILLHILASLAAFWLGWELLRSTPAALLGALLFAAHPMHTESVAWIAGITDIGCGLFYFVSLAAYLRSRMISTGKGLWQTVAVLSFLSALLFKEMALTLPVIVLLIELTNREEGIGRRFRSNAGMWVGLGLVLLVYVSLRIHALGAFSRTVLPLPMQLWDRALTTAYLVGRYLQDLLLPVRQNAYHVFRPSSWLSPSQWLLPLVLLIAQSGLAWMFWRKKETKLLFLTCFTVVTLAPVLNIGGVGQNVYTERYLYIPSLGFCLMAGTAAVRLCRDRIMLTGIGAALVLTFSLLTVLRNPVWRENRSLYQSTVKSSPDSALMRNNLGKLYFADRDFAAARREFQAALEADSRAFARSHSDQATSLLGLGSVASAEGNLDVAWKYAEQASRMKVAVHRSDAFMLMGMVLAKKQSYHEAEKLLRYAIEMRPGNEAAHVNLGNVFLGRGDWAGAEREFRTAVALNPKAPGALISLAILLSRTRRHEEAARLVREVLALDPRNPHAVRLQRQLESGQ